MHAPTRTALALAASLVLTCFAATSAHAQVTFYEHDNFRGRTFVTDEPVTNFMDFGFNDRASSIVVISNRWEVCDNVNYGGRCVMLRPGSYSSLAGMGLNDRVSSVRLVARRDDAEREPPAAPEEQAAVTFYENDNFLGRAFGTQQSVANFMSFGFNDRASSIVVTSNRWEVCDNVNYGGRCVLLRPGSYPSLAAMGLNDRISSLRLVARRGDTEREPPAAPPEQNAVTFYENDNFQGRAFGTQQSVANFMQMGFNDRASSIVVTSSRWVVCDDVNFAGRCAMLRPGSYPSLSAMGLNDRISSLRMVDANGQANDERSAPPPPSAWRRRANERLYEVNVSSVRAVVGPPEQRCWVERQVVDQPRDNSNVPGALAGALIGGIIGHQIGGGTGRDIATAGGVMAGAVVGSRINSNGQRVASQDVQRCRTVPGPQSADYWDVSYNFRGRDHRVQMSRPPGPTITVNRQGEPRG